MSIPCIDHLDFCGDKCPDCGLDVDEFGNTENQFDYCSFPNCGCDGARLCMAKEGPSERSCKQNVEGMWGGGTPERLAAVGAVMHSLAKENGNE